MKAIGVRFLTLMVIFSLFNAPAAAQTTPQPGEEGPANGARPGSGASVESGDSHGEAQTKQTALTPNFSEGFDDITALPAAGWVLTNNSQPLGSSGWFQGNPASFSAYAGGVSAYISANFQNTTGGGTISNWLLTPPLEFWNGDTLSFYTRTTLASTWPDRLEMRLSLNGDSSDVGATATSVGDFSTLLLSVNPTLASGGYPDAWTRFTATVEGLSVPTLGRVGFRYFVTNGGPSAPNSNYIGIDEFEYITNPDIQVSPAAITATQAANTQFTQSLTIDNLGAGVLTYTLETQADVVALEFPTDPLPPVPSPPARPSPLLAAALEGLGPSIEASQPALATSPVALVLDDGSGEDAIGKTAGGQLLWLNRFTPGPTAYPFRLEEVWLLFRPSNNVLVGELVDLYVYQDADGDPSNGADHVASFHDMAVQYIDGTTWSVFVLATPVRLTGPGDVLIAVVNRTAGTDPGEFPATIDQTASHGRSWVGLETGDPEDPPVLPASTFGTIDSFGFPGNWMIRGYGTQGCQGPGIPWLSISPDNGAVPPFGSSTLDVTFDTTGLALGTYSGFICIDSNDPNTPLVEVPVSLEVIPAVYGLEMSAAEAALSGGRGEVVTYTLTVTNTGNAPDTFNLALQGNNWVTELEAPALPLAPGASGSVMVSVMVPVGAHSGEQDVVTVTATSQGDATLSAGVTLTTSADVPVSPVFLPLIKR